MKTKLKTILNRTNLVGVITSQQGMKVALDHPNITQLFEWRVDCDPTINTEDNIRILGRPIIVTVRDRGEGGQQPFWGSSDRIALYKQHMPLATLVDIEASTAGDLSQVIAMAKRQGVGVIISLHILTDSWRSQTIERAIKVCGSVGGDIFKVALLAGSFEEACEFIGLIPSIERRHKIKIAPMLMGEFGKISRLLFGLNKTILTYCSLSQAQIEGQWRASEFRRMLKKVR